MKTVWLRVWHGLLMVLTGGLVTTLLVACGGSAASTAVSRTGGGSSGESTAYQSGAGKTDTEVSSAGGAATGATSRAAAPVAGGNSGQAQTAPQNITVPDVPKQIIKNGNLSLTVKDVDGAVIQIRGIALQHGGDVTQSSSTKTGDFRVADIIIQVDSGRFEDAMAALRQLNGMVVDRKVDKTDSKDVTEEFVDVKAQITTLEATERQLRALLDRATRTEEILTIQREITNVRSQIDRLQGRANYLERRSAMSTITLHLEPESAPALTPNSGWRFSEVVARAWASSLRLLEGVATVVVSVAVFSWWILPLLFLGWQAWRLYRRRGAAPAAPAAPPPPAPATPTGD